MEINKSFEISHDDIVKLMDEFEELHQYKSVILQLKQYYPTIFNLLCKIAGRKISETIIIDFKSSE